MKARDIIQHQLNELKKRIAKIDRGIAALKDAENKIKGLEQKKSALNRDATKLEDAIKEIDNA